MLVRVLGPLEVLDGEQVVTPAGPLQRRLLTALVLHAGRVVSADRLADLLWPGALPDDHLAALQTHVYRLRRRLPGGSVEQQPPGYRLTLGTTVVDAERFERAVSGAASLLPADPAAALDELDEAMGWWRGEPYDDLADADEGRVERERLLELHRRASEERFEALLALGRPTEVVADAEAFVARHPVRERARSILMTALDRCGRRADALRVYDDYRRTLADELGVDPSPALRAQHDALLVAGEGEQAAGQPARPAASVPAPPAGRAPTGSLPTGTLPRPVSALIGRDELLDELVRLVDGHRLVTALGAGGAGKTRLAVEAAHRGSGRFPEGTFFCDLTQAGAAGVAVVLATTLGVEPREGVAPHQRLAEALRHERVLVVLDNCEHVLDEVAVLAEHLLGATEHLHVLATSRERLRVDGESLCPVPPLPWSRDDGAIGEAGPAEELFADRARSVDESFTLDAGTLPLVTDICRRLDGLPLAIELAATRLHALGLAEIRAGLDQRFALLAGGRRAVPRHRSLAAALEWSYDLLDAGERTALDELGVFVGPFTVDDAATVMATSPGPARARLADLGDRCLVHRSGDRFVLLETVRQFALDRLAATGHLEVVRRRHASRMLAVAEGAFAEVRQREEHGTLAALERWMPDLRAGVDHAVSAGEADTALRMVVALRDCAFFGMLPEPLGWAERAARLGQVAGHPLVPEALGVAALAAWNTGDLAGASRLVAEAKDELRRAGRDEPFVVADVQGTVALSTGRPADALHHYRAAVAGTDATSDPLFAAEDAVMVATCLAYLGRTDEAMAEADRVLGLVETAGPLVASWCWYGAGEVLLELDPPTARHRLARAEELALATGARFVAGVAGTSLASIDARHGDPAAAVARYRWLLPLWVRAGVRVTFWTMLRSVVELLARVGADEAAARLLGGVESAIAGGASFGADDARLGRVRVVLGERLGRPRLDELVAEGRRLDDAAAAAVAAAAFDEV